MSLTKNNLLLYKEIDNIAILTLNRPNQQNALSSNLMETLLKKVKRY